LNNMRQWSSYFLKSNGLPNNQVDPFTLDRDDLSCFLVCFPIKWSAWLEEEEAETTPDILTLNVSLLQFSFRIICKKHSWTMPD
jgi:hypothetical protein